MILARRLVIAGERVVGQWLRGAGGLVRREGGAPAAARTRDQSLEIFGRLLMTPEFEQDIAAISRRN
jgi:hypothetical protein